MIAHMRIATLLGLASLLLLLSLLSAPDRVRTQGNDAPCAIETSAEVAPTRLLVGETAAVTLSLRADCPGLPARQNMVFVIDGSGSMTGDRNVEMKKGALAFVARLGLDGSEHFPVRLGVVMFNSAAKILCQLTTEGGRIRGCIRRIGVGGNTNPAEGVNAALRALRRGRPPEGGVRESILLVSDAEMGSLCGGFISAVRKAQSEGVHVAAVCLSVACDHACMRGNLSEPLVYRLATGPADMAAAVDEAATELLELSGPGQAAERVLSVHVADAVSIVPDSISPLPDDRISGLSWREGQLNPPGLVSRSPFTVTFAIRPQRAGRHSILDRAVVLAADRLGRTASVDVDLPDILALEPGPRPTRDPLRTPTPRPTNTARPTPTATATPLSERPPPLLPTADPRRGIAYLPLLLDDVLR